MRKTSLFQKILGTSILIVIIPMVVFRIYSTKAMERMVVEQVMTETGDSVYLAASNIENLLSKIVSVQLFLYEDKELKEIAQETLELPLNSMDSDISKMLNIRFADRVDEILNGLLFNTVVMHSNVTLVTSNGMILTNYNYDSSMYESILSKYMTEAKTGLKTIDWVGISENVDNSIYNQDDFMITLLKSMDISKREEQRANLLVSIMENPLSELLAGTELQNRRFLVDQNGTIISSNDKTVLNTELVFIVEDIPMGKEYGSLVFNSEKQGEILVTYRKLNLSPWMVLDVKPYEQIAADIRENNRQLLLVNLTFIGIFLLIAGVFAGNISRPLRRLAETMVHTDLEKPADKLKNSELGSKEISRIYQCYEIMRIQILNLMKQNQEIEERKRETELAALQAQIKPHFLFNTLMSIRCAIQNGHSDKAVDMTQALASFLRMSIVKTDEVIPLSQEIENLQNYVYIQNMRSSQRYELITNIEPDLIAYPVPKLIFQPLIENSIVHGFSSKESGVIVFDAVKADGKVKITISDNGCGFMSNPLEQKEEPDSGFGVRSVVQRIQLYYCSEYGLQYFSNKGTQVLIYLPERWGAEYDVSCHIGR